MKRMLFFLCIACCVFAASLSGQIVANHTIVDKYDDIPQQYIDSVKKMLLVVPGESHSAAYRDGLTELETVNSVYAVDVRGGEPPMPYTDINLRVCLATWGDVNNETGWMYGYGEEDWFTSETAIERTKAGITYCSTQNLTIGAMGFGWCWDPAITDFSDYINATRSYNDYCADSINTKVFFTTGTVDSYTGETGYLKHLGYESIRDSVNDHPAWILFDYADILCYADDGTDSTTAWDGHIYPVIATNNFEGSGTGHIGMNGALRLAKAMWWMLARIKGWDGAATGVSSNPDEILPAQFSLNQNYPNPFNPATTITFTLAEDAYVSLKVFDMLGREAVTLVNEHLNAGVVHHTILDASQLSSGMYFYRLEAGKNVQVKKLMLLK